MTLGNEVVLVTGSTDGLGRALAFDLAAAGATVLCHGRDERRGRALVAAIVDETDNRAVSWHRADLASLDQVRRLAREISAMAPDLTALVSNAGIGPREPGSGRRVVSDDGHELRFAVNYLAGFALSGLLGPVLSATARRSGRATRVVSVASSGQAAIDFKNVMLAENYDGFDAYHQSKLAQVAMTFDRAQDFERTLVAWTVLHPSTYMPTKMVRTAETTIEQGVNAVRQALIRAADEVNGRYFDSVHESRAHPQAYDIEARRELRELSQALCAVDDEAR